MPLSSYAYSGRSSLLLKEGVASTTGIPVALTSHDISRTEEFHVGRSEQCKECSICSFGAISQAAGSCCDSRNLVGVVLLARLFLYHWLGSCCDSWNLVGVVLLGKGKRSLERFRPKRQGQSIANWQNQFPQDAAYENSLVWIVMRQGQGRSRRRINERFEPIKFHHRSETFSERSP
jgi:hypothetical protein